MSVGDVPAKFHGARVGDAVRYRILLLNDHPQFGGGGDAVLRLERRFYEEDGHEAYLFAPTSADDAGVGPLDILHRESAVPALRKVGKFSFNPALYLRLRKVLAELKPDVVRLHLTAKYPQTVLSALAHVPVIHTLHGPNLFCATSWGCVRTTGKDCEMRIGVKCSTRGCVSAASVPVHSWVYQTSSFFARRNVALYLCPSRQIQSAADRLGFAPTEHLPLGIDRIFMEVELARHDGPPTVLYVGALIEQKGVAVLVRAFAEVRRQVPNATLVIAGTGVAEGHLRTLVDGLGLREAVHFTGFVGRDELCALYRSASVLAVPSIWKEQFGLIGPEALACGIPCVATEVGGIPEWLQDGKWGFLVPPRQSEPLAQRLALLLTSKGLRLRMGREGSVYARTVHSPERYKKRLLELVAMHARRRT